MLRFATQLTERVEAAKTRVVKLTNAVSLLKQGSHNAGRMYCTELLLLQFADNSLHYTSDVNGCGRDLRRQLTELWHQCVSSVAMPIIGDNAATAPMKLAALTAVASLWDDHDLAFLQECDIWVVVQSGLQGTVDPALKDTLWAVLAQLVLVSFRKRAASVQTEKWKDYVIKSIIQMLDPTNNADQSGLSQMLSLISLCMPTSADASKDRQMLMELLQVVVPMVSNCRMLAGMLLCVLCSCKVVVLRKRNLLLPLSLPKAFLLISQCRY